MDYEKKYKEALERCRGFYAKFSNKQIKEEIEDIFPELKESEGERIRKDIVFYIAAHHKDDEEKARWLYWLEKQGEQKHIIIPKFRVGDEICWKGDIDNNDTIAKICDGYYLNPLGNRMDMSYTDTNFELVKHEIVKEKEWTINDAKDGDMLSYVTGEGNLWIMIYWSLYKPYEGHVHYHALLVDDNFTDKGTCFICIDNY